MKLKKSYMMFSEYNIENDLYSFQNIIFKLHDLYIPKELIIIISKKLICRLPLIIIISNSLFQKNKLLIVTNKKLLQKKIFDEHHEVINNELRQLNNLNTKNTHDIQKRLNILNNNIFFRSHSKQLWNNYCFIIIIKNKCDRLLDDMYKYRFYLCPKKMVDDLFFIIRKYRITSKNCSTKISVLCKKYNIDKPIEKLFDVEHFNTLCIMLSSKISLKVIIEIRNIILRRFISTLKKNKIHFIGINNKDMNIIFNYKTKITNTINDYCYLLNKKWNNDHSFYISLQQIIDEIINIINNDELPYNIDTYINRLCILCKKKNNLKFTKILFSLERNKKKIRIKQSSQLNFLQIKIKNIILNKLINYFIIKKIKFCGISKKNKYIILNEKLDNY